MIWKDKKAWLLALAFGLAAITASPAAAQYSTSGSLEDPDAIAVRVVPNPNHYSIVRWYETQGFAGSPQSLTVDGYEAIRDGRTVYVNAANVDTNSKTVYTNIYLISYNQDPVAPTVDILGQLVSRWKFNSNLSESGSPKCSFSALSCTSDADCAENQLCSASGPTAGSCILREAKNCLVDTDCPTAFFCNSQKAKITRDIKRIGLLEELKESLATFRRTNSRYPFLAAGTYLAGHSLSVWPSWDQELLSNLAAPASFHDPVNRMGPCVPYGQSGVAAGYDPATCWNAESRKFINEPSGATLPLPAGSYAFVYSTDQSGATYNLCATLESRAMGYRFSPNDPADSACLVATGIGAGGLSSNTAPRLLDTFLVGEPNKEFNGYIRVDDAESDILSWSWASQPGHSNYGWSGWVRGGQSGQPPVLQDTSNPYQKKVHADKAGQPGTYNLVLRVSDGLGGTLTTSTPITIASDPITLEAADAEYEADTANYFSYRLTFSGNGFSNPTANTPVLTRTSGPYDLFNVLSSFTKTISTIGGKYQVEYRGLIPTSYKFPNDVDFRYNVRVTDSSGTTAQKSFAIKVKAAVPALNFSCASAARQNKYYSCLLGSARQGGHTLDYYGSSGYPGGLSVVSQPSGVYLAGTPASLSAGQTVTIKAANEYGAFSTKAFDLKVNNYCGDGSWQSPNNEGRGGIYNDGYEDCDGSDRVVGTPQQSDASHQYGCSTTASTPRPYPIFSNDQCVFLPPSSGGGYCGDGYCQVRINNIEMETKANCPQDCSDDNGGNCVPSCTGRSCGNDGCGGSCGTCGSGKVCTVAGNCITAACATDADCRDTNPCTTSEHCVGGGTPSATCAFDTVGYSELCVGESWYEACAFGQTTPCSTGICRVTPSRSCSGAAFGACSSVDPRISYCVGKCEGETNSPVYGNQALQCNGGAVGLCKNTGNGDACLDGSGNKIEQKDCSDSLGWPAGSWLGVASCQADCSGYNTSSCVPNVCNTINPPSPSGCYWYKAPDETVATPGKTCMVKMSIKSDGSVDCSDFPQPGQTMQWLRGTLVYSGTTFCSVAGCDHFVNPNKCRYLNNLWSNQCFVPIN